MHDGRNRNLGKSLYRNLKSRSLFYFVLICRKKLLQLTDGSSKSYTAAAAIEQLAAALRNPRSRNSKSLRGCRPTLRHENKFVS